MTSGKALSLMRKCERVKLPVTYMHRLYFAYIAVLRAFRDLQDGFSFVVQLCTDMSSCVIIPPCSNAVRYGYASYIRLTSALRG